MVFSNHKALISVSITDMGHPGLAHRQTLQLKKKAAQLTAAISAAGLLLEQLVETDR